MIYSIDFVEEKRQIKKPLKCTIIGGNYCTCQKSFVTLHRQ